jgi:hypothetical protein
MNEKALATSLNSNGHFTSVVPTVPLTYTEFVVNDSWQVALIATG